jgi:hypothetical protein
MFLDLLENLPADPAKVSKRQGPPADISSHEL